jgi:DNA-binding transcriptional MerR regulator
VQLNFLQEDLLAALKESESPSSTKTKNTATGDLFGGLPLAMPKEKTSKNAAKAPEEIKPSPKEKPAAEPVKKAETAFKTISEAAAILDVPQHVLRFWESRFSQVKPLKMGGGRRYYRPEDIDTLSKIRNLLYKQGYTIKGAKKAFGIKDKQPAEIADIPSKDKILQLTDKQKKQVTAIRQELIGLREVLRPYLANAT